MTKSLTGQDVREVAARVARDAVASGAAGADRQGGIPADILHALGSRGLLGLLIPEELGGAGLGLSELVVAAEAIGSACPSTALVMVTHSAACEAVRAGGGSALRQRVLPGLASGRLLAGFAVHEMASGCMLAPIETRASRAGGGFRIRGQKPFVTVAGKADLFVVLADLESAGPSLLVVDGQLPGVTRGRPEEALGLRGAAVAELSLDDCLLPPEALLGKGGDGLPLLRDSLGALGRFGLAGAALGLARHVQASTFDHLRSRTTAGTVLGERAPVAAAAAEIAMTILAMDVVLARCIERAERAPDRRPMYAAEAKLFATEGAAQVARVALQLTGAHGFFGAGGIERCLRDALGLTVHLGPSSLLREEIGRFELREATSATARTQAVNQGGHR
jgi:acyl-CoA dehydrogenase